MVAAKTDEDTMLKAWLKITGQEITLGRAGYIPVWDGEGWRLFRNTVTIYESVENAADPIKVEQLRLNVRSLYGMFPDSVPRLEKLGVRVKRLLNTPIKTTADVHAWANSIFNLGPVSEPERVGQTQALLYDVFTMHVGKTYVLPAKPWGSDDHSVVEFNGTGKAKVYPANSPVARKAFGDTEVRKAPAKRVRKPKPVDGMAAAVVESEPAGATISVHGKALGRPRADGLAPGSKEAKLADAEKKRLYQANRRKQIREAAADVAPTGATVVAIADAPKPRFKNIGRRNRTA